MKTRQSEIRTFARRTAPRGRRMGAGALLALVLLWPAESLAQAQLDTTQFIVVGEGLAAGFGDFGLKEVFQDKSFPAQMARQMRTLFPQPLIQSPGIGNAPGFATLPTGLPKVLQDTVRVAPVITPNANPELPPSFSPNLFVFNLSVPGFRLADSLNRRPTFPMIQQRDAQQTVTNMILGYPAMIAGKDLPLWTQAEYAVNMNPTFVVVELGYYDVLEPAVTNNPSRLPDVTTFRNNLNTLLARLKTTSPQILVMTIPDPFDTAFFTTLPETTRLVGAPANILASRYKLRADDLLTPDGLMNIGNLVLGDVIIDHPLFTGLADFIPGTVVSATTQTAVRARVTALNTEITNAAREAGALVYDLKSLFTRIKTQGLTIGNRTLTAEYLGGFYTLDGYYPGATGHALIANEVLQLLNTTYGTSFPLLNLTTISTGDPAVRFTPAKRGRDQGMEELQ